MRRGRREQEGAVGGVGDWSSTGTFLRKPPTGWLHDDRELMTGSCIDYEVYYLGCIEVKQSMRTLQFGVRTQVTKEAILRLAEAADKVFMGKKRKVPKQINKILGVVDRAYVGDMNLSVSVDALKISNVIGNSVMDHSLPSISFASGGDGPTADYIGYVAKDPIHNRACHVFECPNSSQYVLATIGQAFELRYKIYLKTPRPNVQPVSVSDSWQGTDAWGRQGSSSIPDSPTDEEIVTTPPAPSTPPPSYAGLNGDTSAGIYSDIPEFPPELPPPLPEARTQVYNNLPKFPPDIETISRTESLGGEMVRSLRLDNPYDTMPSDAQMEGEAVYSNPGEVTSSSDRSSTYEETGIYDTRLMTIKQTSSLDDSDLIELTPSGRNLPTPDYSNVRPNGEIDHKTKPYPSKPPRPPVPSHKPTLKGSPELGKRSPPKPRPKPGSVYKPVIKQDSTDRKEPEAIYDDPDVLGKVQSPKVKVPLASTRPGMYDDIGEVIGHRKNVNSTNGDQDNVYDDVDDDLRRIGAAVPRSPKFDDTIYNRIPGNGQAAGPKQSASSVPDPLAPLPHQQYFHGQISRVEAEALLMSDGEFLVRESTKRAGQYVLTGMAGGRIQHLLLMDKQGRVKSKDREFESIPDLVRYFRDKQSALIIGDSQVYLRTPVVNAFLS